MGSTASEWGKKNQSDAAELVLGSDPAQQKLNSRKSAFYVGATEAKTDVFVFSQPFEPSMSRRFLCVYFTLSPSLYVFMGHGVICKSSPHHPCMILNRSEYVNPHLGRC